MGKAAMFSHPSLITRIGIGKAVGFVIGLSGFIALSYFAPETSVQMRWGVLLWYTTLGAIIGVFGVLTSHPVLKLPFPWWIRAPILGGWMNFVLTLFAYDALRAMMVAAFGLYGMFQSPYWFVLEGVVVGAVIGYLATRFGGEGPETVEFDAADRGAAT